MTPRQPTDYLWANICALAGVPPTISVDAMHAVLSSTGIGRGTVQRMKEREGHRTTEQLAKLAEFFGIEVWQLLVPGIAKPAAFMARGKPPLTNELMSAIESADGEKRLMIENAARAMLGLPVIPPASGEFGNGTNG